MKSSKDLLAENIDLLTIRQTAELNLIKEQFHITYESLKPINYVKNALREIVNSPDIKKNLLQSALGMASRYLTKKIVTDDSSNPFKKVLGFVLQFVVARVVSNKSDTIIQDGVGQYQKLFTLGQKSDIEDALKGDY